jgi:hypothetical protein
MLGKEASFDKRECVMKLAVELQFDEKVFERIFEYAADEEVWLESETNESFSTYLAQLAKVIKVVDKE